MKNIDILPIFENMLTQSTLDLTKGPLQMFSSKPWSLMNCYCFVLFFILLIGFQIVDLSLLLESIFPFPFLASGFFFIYIYLNNSVICDFFVQCTYGIGL